MLTTIAAAAITGFAGIAIGASFSTSGLRRRVGQLEQLSGVIPEMVTRAEVSDAFNQLALIEQQRHAVAQQALMERQRAAQFINPVFRTEAASGTFQAEVAPRGGAPSAGDVNALLNQQLTALNERLQQVTSQRMPA